MAKTKTFRRNRARQRRIRILLLAVVVALVLLVAGVWGVTVLLHQNAPAGESGGAQPTDGGTTSAPTTTTTTYPDLSADAVAQLDALLTGRNILLYDETHGKVLYAREESAACYPASLTKLMTAAVAAKYATGDPYEIGSEVYLCDPQASSAYLKLGTKLTLPQALNALLLPSGADAAYALAVTTARRLYPSEELSNFEAAQRFCDLMNQTAAEIGCTDTRFINPDGIYHTNHTTTAADLLKILQFARSFPAVREAMGLPSVSFDTEDGKTYSYTNTNRLLNTRTPYYYSYCTGGKTGYTDEAGYCLAATAEKDGVTLLVLVLGCAEENARFTEAAALFNAGFALAAGA